MAKDEFELDLSKHGVVKPSALNRPELMIFAGRPGSGKTHLAATAANVEGLYPVLIIDTEGSTAGTLAGFDDDRIDIMQIDDHDDFETLTNALLTKTHKYKTVIIDTFDVAQDRAVADFQENSGNDGYAAWRDVKGWTIDLARNFKAAPFLGIFVFHLTQDQTESGAVIQTLVLQGSAKEVVPGIPDVVGLTTRKFDKEAGREVTSVKFAPDPKTPSKNRFGLPQTMVDITLSDVYDHIAKRNKKEEK